MMFWPNSPSRLPDKPQPLHSICPHSRPTSPVQWTAPPASPQYAQPSGSPPKLHQHSYFGKESALPDVIEAFTAALDTAGGPWEPHHECSPPMLDAFEKSPHSNQVVLLRCGMACFCGPFGIRMRLRPRSHPLSFEAGEGGCRGTAHAGRGRGKGSGRNKDRRMVSFYGFRYGLPYLRVMSTTTLSCGTIVPPPPPCNVGDLPLWDSSVFKSSEHLTYYCPALIRKRIRRIRDMYDGQGNIHGHLVPRLGPCGISLKPLFTQ